MPRRIIRPKEAQKRLGVGHSKFYEDFVNSGRLRLVRLGPKSVGVIEDELDAFIDQLIDARDAALSLKLK
jgi:predicted DNA-binding transcriptional regulator AlpA